MNKMKYRWQQTFNTAFFNSVYFKAACVTSVFSSGSLANKMMNSAFSSLKILLRNSGAIFFFAASLNNNVASDALRLRRLIIDTDGTNGPVEELALDDALAAPLLPVVLLADELEAAPALALN
jgi:hypothetical protein